jgi:hypothetical protein
MTNLFLDDKTFLPSPLKPTEGLNGAPWESNAEILRYAQDDDGFCRDFSVATERSG